MQWTKKMLFSAILMGLGVVSLQTGDAQGAVSLCGQDEAVMFTCPVAGNKVLSVCSSKVASTDTGFLQYRYGKAGKTEISLPAAKTAPSKSAQGGTLAFSGGGGAYLRFQNGSTDYYVYTAIGKWGKNGKTATKAGVAVESKGKLKTNIRCTAPETSELGPDMFEKMGVPEDTSDFDLPE